MPTLTQRVLQLPFANIKRIESKTYKGIFIVESLHGFVVTPDGQVHFTLRLQTPQVRSLGDQVKVEFKVQPNWYYNDTRCAQFKSIVFDKENWEKPQ